VKKDEEEAQRGKDEVTTRKATSVMLLVILILPRNAKRGLMHFESGQV
jgi:hypothetical protein